MSNGKRGKDERPTHPLEVRQHLHPEERPQIHDTHDQLVILHAREPRVERDHAGRDELVRVVLERADRLPGCGGDDRLYVSSHELVQVLSAHVGAISATCSPHPIQRNTQGKREGKGGRRQETNERTHIGHLNASLLNNGNTNTCNDAHGLSPASAVLTFGALCACACAWASACPAGAMLSARLLGGAASAIADGASASEGRWASVPRRCISRETSLESYVRVEDACVLRLVFRGVSAGDGSTTGKNS